MVFFFFFLILWKWKEHIDLLENLLLATAWRLHEIGRVWGMKTSNEAIETIKEQSMRL